MKIKDLEKWENEYYPYKEKIRRKKTRKNDLYIPKKSIINKKNKNKL